MMSSLLTILTISSAVEKSGPTDEARDEKGRWSLGGGSRKIPFLYHGTSSKRFEAIKREGLKPGFTANPVYQLGSEKFSGWPPLPSRGVLGPAYVTTDPKTAILYAYNAARGDKSEPLVIALDRSHSSLKGLTTDPEYAALHQDRLKEKLPEPAKQHAFMANKTIPTEAIHHVVHIGRTAIHDFLREAGWAKPAEPIQELTALQASWLTARQRKKVKIIPG